MRYLQKIVNVILFIFDILSFANIQENNIKLK